MVSAKLGAPGFAVSPRRAPARDPPYWQSRLLQRRHDHQSAETSQMGGSGELRKTTGTRPPQPSAAAPEPAGREASPFRAQSVTAVRDMKGLLAKLPK